jgi:hypothetical protein
MRATFTKKILCAAGQPVDFVVLVRLVLCKGLDHSIVVALKISFLKLIFFSSSVFRIKEIKRD